jgi:hydroxypyruvate reductase
MNPEILIVPQMLESLCGELEQEFTLHRYWQMDGIDAVKAQCGAVRGVATNGQCGASAELIAALPALEVVASYGVGVDQVHFPSVKARNVIVTTTPDVLTEDVADMAIMLMLSAIREMVAGDRFIRSGQWVRGERPVARRVGGKRLGILGLGRIGRAVARKAEVFGMSISYADQAPIAGVPYTYHGDVESLARNSDVLVVLCAASEATRHIVNERVIDALGPSGIIVNVARGSLIDEDALVRALKDKRLGAAALDVFAREPVVPAPLLVMDNVILQPHQGSGTRECRQAMADLVVANLKGHFLGNGVVTPLPSS